MRPTTPCLDQRNQHQHHDNQQTRPAAHHRRRPYPIDRIAKPGHLSRRRELSEAVDGNPPQRGQQPLSPHVASAALTSSEATDPGDAGLARVPPRHLTNTTSRHWFGQPTDRGLAGRRTG